MIRNFGQEAIHPWAYDKVPEGVRQDYKPATWGSLSYRPELPPMGVWGPSSDFPPLKYDDEKLAPVE